ncbi:hypothetical protein BGX24_010776 [Mortierella sp. AD032]|nr:hypothetical protein BGX24_010776 [Mortierella sp. AD032]
MYLPALSPSASSVASSLTPASTSYLKQRKATHSKATLFLITLTLACCLLATSSSNCLAAPIASISLRQQQQRSLAYQVHHVQVADESVHNNVVLLKKSIQKRRSQNNKRQQQPQQQQKRGHETEIKMTKRHGKREFVDSFHVPVPENYDDKNNRVQHTDSSLNNNDANVGDASALSIVDSIATTAADARSSSTSSEPHDNSIIQPINKNQQKQSQKKKHRATRLLSAYESIVFSESQIPVFLTQDRHHNNKLTNDKQRKQRQQRPILRAQNQGYIRIRKGTAASQELDDAMIERNNNAERHQNPITADSTNAKASSSSSPPSAPVDEDVAVVQADDMHHLLSSSSFSASASIVLGSGLEHSVAQDAAASNNNNLQSDHVDDRGDDKGVTTTTKDDKNSSFLLDNSHASTVASVFVPVEQQEDFEESFPIVDTAVMDENGDTSSATPILEAVVVLEIKAGEEGALNPPSAGEELVVAVMEAKAVVQVESSRSGNEDEEEDGWVTITDADLVGSSSKSDNIVSSNDSHLASNIVEFQSPGSDDVDSIPLSVDDSSNGPIPQEQQHHQHTAPTAAATKSLFHNGCSSSSTVASLGLLLTAIGLAYRFYIRKQQQEQSLRLALPFNDVKIAPLSSSSSSSSSSSKSVHRLSVDSLPSPTMREGGARTTAVRDYVGFNIQ